MSNLCVIVDADACPRSCLKIVQKLAREYKYEVITIASFNHQIDNPNHFVVGNESQATDIAVINRTRVGDIVVTQDWGLAAMVLAKGGKAIAPNGRIFRTDQIDLLLEERNVLAKFRRAGGRTSGPAKRTPSDDLYFTKSLIELLDSPPH